MFNSTDFDWMFNVLLIFFLYIDGNGMEVMDFKTLMRRSMLMFDFMFMFSIRLMMFIVLVVVMNDSTKCDANK